ncbi:MAG: filamentous hemagglutinin family outer membrane protein [Gammaproteobacteria bacterium]|nr:filamentous hemagglutinin family outer membrane protein [Gammaproteobacteria bacterium]
MNRCSDPNEIRTAPCLRRVLATVLACALAANAVANPTGAQTVAGQVSAVSSGNQLLITNSPGAIINWQSFSIMPGELTRFIQQTAASSVLNRITGQNPSQILGALQSNGKVFLINPNGILFGAGAQVNVNGLVASSLELSNADFLAGKLKFSSTGRTGDVSNRGAITTPGGGQVYLIAPNVSNEGIITSPGGDVMLAAGQSVELADSNDPDMRVVVSAPGDQALNVGKVVAQSGRVGIYGALINQLGVVSANSAVAGANGKVVFKSSGDTMLGAGSVTTATGAGTGGEIQVLGNRVGLTADARVDASGQTGGGVVLIGGDNHGSNAAIQNAALTYVGPDVRIKADALQSGAGGAVIVWSDQQTQMYGDISARGGAQGGNGGLVETSSRNSLDYRGLVDLRAPQGGVGTLLLDPSDISIESGASTGDITLPGSAPFTVTGSNPTSVLSVTDLQNQLNLGNVTVATSSGASAPSGGSITVATPVSWSNANSLTLAANQNVNIDAPITASTGTLVLTAANGSITQPINASVPPAISVASLAASAPGGTVTLTELTNNVSGAVAGTGQQGFSFANSGPIAVGTVGSAVGITSSNGTVRLAAAAGDISQVNGPIVATAASAVASNGRVLLVDATNSIGVVAGRANGNFSVVDNVGFTVGAVSGAGILSAVGGISVSNASGIGVALQTPLEGDITIAAPIQAGGSEVLVGAAGAVVQGTGGLITAGSLAVGAGSVAGVGSSGTPLLVDVASLWSANSQGGVYLRNTGNLTIDFISASGVVNVSSGGSLNTPIAAACDCTRSISGSSVTLSAFGPMVLSAGAVVSATDAVWLSAGYDVSSGTYASSNALTIDGNVSGVTVALFAGGAIGITGQVTGVVTQMPLQYPPTSLAPSLAQCIAAPTLAGCSAVLPTLAECSAAPQTPGCSVVLPSLAQCTVAPTSAGCTAVLPSLAQCTALPTAPGCSAVLPTLAQCTSTPAAAGCSAVLPSLAQCTATPTTPGCGAVLPTLAQCTSTPAAAGCSAVLPSLAQCTATPTTLGCSAVLPTLAQCTSTPVAAGCSAVLPSLAQCTATPTTPGCGVVLPSLAQCTAAPTLTGCAAVLPSLTQCTATPTAPGCGVVLPSLAQCTVAPTLAGCSAVLPTLTMCTSNSQAAGCIVVLPPATQTRDSAPISQAISTTINIINTSTTTVVPVALNTKSPVTSTDKTSAGATGSSDPSGAGGAGGVKNDAKKLYCN